MACLIVKILHIFIKTNIMPYLKLYGSNLGSSINLYLTLILPKMNNFT